MMHAECAVVVPSRGDLPALERIVKHIAEGVRPIDTLVILNGTNNAELAESEKLAAKHGIRTVRCPGGGVARARNLAIAILESPIIVYADDDVILNTAAVLTLADSIRKGHGEVVAARVLPAPSPDGHLDAIYHSYLGFDRGAVRRIWSRSDGQRHLSPFAIWNIGVGALFAINREKVARTAMVRFDERLSNGTFCGGTEDVDFFMQAFRAGLTLAYEPGAVAHHVFPSDWTNLRRKCNQYALSDGAFYAKWYNETKPADYVREMCGWSSRLMRHLTLAVRRQPAIPLRSLCAELPLKLAGAAYWHLFKRVGNGSRT